MNSEYESPEIEMPSLAGSKDGVTANSNCSNLKKKPIYNFLKRAFDIVGSLLGLIILSPIFLLIGIMIIIDDKGKVFYKHQRVGKNGKPIYIYKFRSMTEKEIDLEKVLTKEQYEQYQREFKIDNDPRITRVGKLLRKSSLDELPQLVNILKGDLSVIGPRPVLYEETLFYGKDRDLLLSVKPGLTGYWQAYARNNVGYENGVRQEMELHYVRNRSIWFDIKIFFKTILTVLSKSGAQ